MLRSSPRQQVNIITAFIDGNMIYGSDKERSRNLREMKNGRLRTGNGDILPVSKASYCVVFCNIRKFEYHSEKVFLNVNLVLWMLCDSFEILLFFNKNSQNKIVRRNYFQKIQKLFNLCCYRKTKICYPTRIPSTVPVKSCFWPVTSVQMCNPDWQHYTSFSCVNTTDWLKNIWPEILR